MASRTPGAGRGPLPPKSEIDGLVEMFRAQRYQDTESAARKLLLAYPDNSILYNMLGAAQTAQDKLEPAIACLERSAELEPRHAGTFNNLGIAQRKLGRHDDAIANFQRAIALKPDYFIARNNLGDTLIEAKRGLDAVAIYRQLIADRPGMLDVYIKLGSALRELGKAADAVDVYERALDVKFDNFAVHNNLGNVLAELGQTQQAAASFRQALRYNPAQAIAHYNLHAIELALHDHGPAIESLRAAVRNSPGETTLELFLGVTLDHAGLSDQAATIFARQATWSDLDRARLDGWRYLKSHADKPPRLLGTSIDIFTLAMQQATLQGAVLEFGVRFGHSIRLLADLTDQTIHGFDSFHGLPEAWGDAPTGEYSTRGAVPEVPRHVQLHQGWFEDTVPAFVAAHPEPVRLMNIDCDIYSSTKTVLDHFARWIVPGSVLVFDEFIGNLSWREDEVLAFEEYVAAHGVSFEYLACSLYTKQVVVRILPS